LLSQPGGVGKSRFSAYFSQKKDRHFPTIEIIFNIKQVNFHSRLSLTKSGSPADIRDSPIRAAGRENPGQINTVSGLHKLR
jgi:hypothetical protein